MMAPGTSGVAGAVDAVSTLVVTGSPKFHGHRTRHIPVFENGECFTRLLRRHPFEGKAAVDQDVLARVEGAVEEREVDIAHDACDVDLCEIVADLDLDDFAGDAQAHGETLT